MSKIIDAIQKYIKPYEYYIIVAIVVIIFCIFSYYVYKYTIKSTIKGSKKLKDVANNSNRLRNADVYFFYTTWCPHCTKAKPEWNEFKTAYDGKEINNFRVNCIEIDCTDDGSTKEDSNSSKVETLINNFKVDSYPTIKLQMDGDETVEFDAKVNKKNLDAFINTILNE